MGKTKIILMLMLISSCGSHTVPTGTKAVTTTIGGNSIGATAQWRQISGSTVKIETPGAMRSRVMFNTKGVYQFELTVYESKLFNKDTVKITVK